jgi:hypothetical protein
MLGQLIGPVTGLLDKFIEDKDAKNAMAHEIATMAEKAAHEAAMAQVAVNQQEAKHKSLFVAGWRPSVGWICSIAMGYHFVLQPVIVFGLTAAGATVPDLPEFDMDSLMTVLLGMLGLGGLRTYEKQKGLTK